MNRPLRIALVAHPRHPIAEPFKGGMEAHSFHLARGLMARGHDVMLFAAGDSNPAFTIDPLLPVHYDRDYPWENTNPHPELYTVLDKAFGAARHRIFSGHYDIVHNNSLHRFVMQEAKRTGLPCVTSLHVPPFDAIHGVVRDTLSDTHHVTVTSARQNISWWGQAIPLQSVVVHNGVDLACWPFEASGGPHAIWCGRITRNKGPHFAIAAAKRAGLSLRLFGYLEDRAYFDQEISPELDEQVTYGGMLEGAALSRELRNAALLLFTPCWDEPFGLIAVEAMASGLPVASFDQGAAREIIGETSGRFAPPGDIDALANAARMALAIPRILPREQAETLFCRDRMIDRYLAVYERAMAARKNGHAVRSPQETLIL
ncbi:glycosyltransferase [Asaia bogorensis]|uniref:glycosyltransferase n=1 Tax=Asaia bogorensis TaxID=91915 RepID=UPI000EFD0247|nr:glycosyltransferase [Asaia bogorensis]